MLKRADAYFSVLARDDLSGVTPHNCPVFVVLTNDGEFELLEYVADLVERPKVTGQDVGRRACAA